MFDLNKCLFLVFLFPSLAFSAPKARVFQGKENEPVSFPSSIQPLNWDNVSAQEKEDALLLLDFSASFGSQRVIDHLLFADHVLSKREQCENEKSLRLRYSLNRPVFLAEFSAESSNFVPRNTDFKATYSSHLLKSFI